MIKMEHPMLPSKEEQDMVQLWKVGVDGIGKTYWVNAATREVRYQKPVLGRGGCLCDEMGLGKVRARNA
jgi:hypothetical protein